MKFLLLMMALLFLSGCTGIVINVYDTAEGAEIHSMMHDFKKPDEEDGK